MCFSMKTSKGFTLIEVVAALAIVGTVFVTLISFVIHQIRIAGLIRDYTYATVFADTELVFLELESKYSDFERPPVEDTGLSDMKQRFTVNVSESGVVYLPVEITGELKMPEVTVQWDDKTYSLLTYLQVKPESQSR